ncbi:ABC transporter substrate-binding protein [Aliidiomarina celeris]|uniref:ABC transporter substrate-binding protein n=1 Tax=Aliidiomarina celeris TaxID=2249428 RepID=UPI000DE8E62A|nr:ABC transporter substrate-binding protein [Aliidiomarina celeris]
MPKPKHLSIALGAPFLLVVSLFLAGCTPAKTPLNIAGNTWLGYQPMYIAHGMNLCKNCEHRRVYRNEVPLNFTMLPSTSLTLRLFTTGELDGALLTLDEALNLQRRTNMDLCVAQVLSYSEGADAVLTLPNFDATQKIRFGYEQTALGGYMASRAAQVLGWSSDNIETEFVVPRAHVNALLENEIDAVVSYEPYISLLRGQGAQVVFSSADIPGEVLDVLVVTRAVWREHKPLLQWLETNFWPAGLAALSSGNEETMRWLSQQTELSSVELGRSLAGIHFITPDETQSVSLQTAVDRIGSFMQAQGRAFPAEPLTLCSEAD